MNQQEATTQEHDHCSDYKDHISNYLKWYESLDRLPEQVLPAQVVRAQELFHEDNETGIYRLLGRDKTCMIYRAVHRYPSWPPLRGGIRIIWSPEWSPC